MLVWTITPPPPPPENSDLDRSWHFELSWSGPPTPHPSIPHPPSWKCRFGQIWALWLELVWSTPPPPPPKIQIWTDLGTLPKFDIGPRRMWRLISVSPADTISFFYCIAQVFVLKKQKKQCLTFFIYCPETLTKPLVFNFDDCVQLQPGADVNFTQTLECKWMYKYQDKVLVPFFSDDNGHLKPSPVTVAYKKTVEEGIVKKRLSRQQQQLRSIRTLGLVILVFLFCWIPFCSFWPISAFCPDCISVPAYEYSYWAAYLNSTVNPVLYFLANRDFRNAFRKLIKWKSDEDG